jgi:RNA polymerase sigma-70 factor (ECF subfamily)
MSEKELVRQAQAGDFAAFSQLVDTYKSRVYGLALRMTGNEQDAQDIVQETLIKAIDNIESFRGESLFGTWLYAIALNQSRAFVSKQKQASLKSIEEYLPAKSAEHMHDAEAPVTLFDWKDPHQLLEQRELRQIIDEAIASLPEKYRVAFLLRYHEELSIKEVAKVIGETVASAKSRVLRARLALRDRLSRIFEDRYGKELQGLR